MINRLKVAVMGAGAVGCYFGGMLARAGHDVVLIARQQHVTAIDRNGLNGLPRSHRAVPTVMTASRH